VPGTRSHADHQREKDGALEANEAEVRQPYVVPRHRLVIAVWLTVLALPILLLDNIPKTEARAASVTVDATRASETTTTVLPTTTAESTTVAAAEVASSPESTPATAAPKTTVKVAVTAPPPRPSTTTTTAPPNTQQGGASWYDYRPGECAHVSLPKGTVVTITSLENGASTTCVVTDRGPYGSGRIIDLDRATFAQIADPARGVVQVEISW
jgi:rare lipoprotein A (peptidoglycan hydrolase)